MSRVSSQEWPIKANPERLAGYSTDFGETTLGNLRTLFVCSDLRFSILMARRANDSVVECGRWAVFYLTFRSYDGSSDIRKFNLPYTIVISQFQENGHSAGGDCLYSVTLR